MKVLRRGLMTAALLLAFGCVILLLNFTAPNPTGRRYSSETPLRTREGSSNQLGQDGERILANDLQLPNNNTVGQCFCRVGRDAGVSRCKICVGQFEAVSRARIPDFVTDTLIADSKNARDIPFNAEEAREIADYALLAQLTNREFWLFVRIDTVVSEEVYQTVKLTGGDVVYYFTTPNYVDPVDQNARLGLAGTVAAFGVLGLWELRGLRGRRQPKLIVLTPKFPKPPKRPNDPIDRALRKADAATDFAQRAKDKQWHELDKD